MLVKNTISYYNDALQQKMESDCHLIYLIKRKQCNSGQSMYLKDKTNH